jgi:hypothetical protein
MSSAASRRCFALETDSSLSSSRNSSNDARDSSLSTDYDLYPPGGRPNLPRVPHAAVHGWPRGLGLVQTFLERALEAATHVRRLSTGHRHISASPGDALVL